MGKLSLFLQVMFFAICALILGKMTWFYYLKDGLSGLRKLF